MTNITEIANIYLRNIANLRHFLSQDYAENLMHIFVTFRFYNCIVLFSGLPNTNVKNLQLVQNAAARQIGRAHV